MIDDFYQLALAAVRHHLNEAGVSHTIDDGDVLFNEHRLGISVTFEDFVTQGGQVIAPLDIQLHLDGDEGDRFRVGTLGIGATREAAMQAAVSEWHMLAAAPLLAALRAPVDKRRAASKQQLAGWDLFPGRAGIRGKIPAGLQSGGDLLRSLLIVLRDAVAKWPVPTHLELRSIYVMVSSGPEGQDVQAAADGLVNPELTEAIRGLKWPGGDDAYLYKQLFVFRREPNLS